MNIGQLMEELASLGICIVWDGQNPVIEGACSDEMADEIREHKQAIKDWIAMERPLTDEEKRRVAEVFQTLRDQHGRALHAAGWHREAVFDGLDPTQCETVADVPGILGLLMSGGRLVQIHPDRLDLEFPDGVPFAKILGSCLLGGKVLDDFLCTGK